MKDLARKRLILTSLILFAGLLTVLLFDTYFIKVTIDYLSFLAGAFLITEAFYKMFHSPSGLASEKASRTIRVIIGLWVFGTHLVQFLRHRVFAREIAEITIDYKDFFALAAGIFLITEGLKKISAAQTPVFPSQVSRIIRVLIGVCLVSIHVLQFVTVFG